MLAQDQNIVLRGVAASTPGESGVRAQLGLFLRSIEPGDYLCLLPYLYRDEPLQRFLYDLVDVLKSHSRFP
ncbi:MAG: hypothetical protein CM1200mP20_11770 [Pseudomonadota bacterium]|nr:MAG: hypothetical protein CM1200mP20_11770 [Pseudomonadota bacterium]